MSLKKQSALQLLSLGVFLQRGSLSSINTSRKCRGFLFKAINELLGSNPIATTCAAKLDPACEQKHIKNTSSILFGCSCGLNCYRWCAVVLGRRITSDTCRAPVQHLLITLRSLIIKHAQIWFGWKFSSGMKSRQQNLCMTYEWWECRQHKSSKAQICDFHQMAIGRRSAKEPMIAMHIIIKLDPNKESCWWFGRMEKFRSITSNARPLFPRWGS